MQDMQDDNGAAGRQPSEKASICRQHRPAGELAQFIELFWYWQKPEPLRGIECVLPTGTVELVIDLDSGFTSNTVVSGMKSGPVVISGNNLHQAGRLLGIHFKPGGAFPFLPFPLQELYNINITLADLWGEQQANDLLSLVYETGSVSEKFTVLEQWLLNHLYHPLCHQPAVTLAASELQSRPNTIIKDLAVKINFSQRHFIRIFQHEMGLVPKLFARINRFQKVLDMIENSDTGDWLGITTACGYYDQSHFIHEFQEFSGITPETYLNIRTEHRNHLPVIN